ncbi:MAG: hypothetical protein JXO72_10600 [Vicinamibacteria bacterium]|nr:hypothetical protein [Vicinamibacteria bacterium]
MTYRCKLLIGILTLVGGLLVLVPSRGVVMAQETPSPEPSAPQPTSEPRRAALPGYVQRVFTLRYVDVGSMARLLKAFPAEISYSTHLPALAVSAKPAIMAVIEQTIKRLDVPPPTEPSIVLTLYVVQAETTPGKLDDLPERLRPVARQLHALFDYSGYTLQDTLVAHASPPGGVMVSSIAPSRAGEVAPLVYDFEARKATVMGSGKDAVLKLEGVRFTAKLPIRTSGQAIDYMNIGLRADTTLHSGQYVVIGKTGLGEEGAVLVLVLTARVIDTARRSESNQQIDVCFRIGTPVSDALDKVAAEAETRLRKQRANEAENALEALERNLKATHGVGKETWPDAATRELERAELNAGLLKEAAAFADGWLMRSEKPGALASAVEEIKKAAKDEPGLRLVAKPEDAFLLCEVIGRRREAVGLGVTYNVIALKVVAGGRGTDMELARLRWPRKHGRLPSFAVLHTYTEAEPFWIVQVRAAGLFRRVTERVVDIVETAVGNPKE